MNNHEEIARSIHRNGNNCSKSVHSAFASDLNLSDDFPAPRSIDGKCGALLTSIKILKEKGLENKIEDFERIFEKKFGYLKCIDLMKNGRKCNDYVGESAKILDEMLKEK